MDGNQTKDFKMIKLDEFKYGIKIKRSFLGDGNFADNLRLQRELGVSENVIEVPKMKIEIRLMTPYKPEMVRIYETEI